MLIFRIVAFLAISLTFFSCSNKQDDSDIVSQHFVHKYGFELTENEWQERDKDGQSITILENGAVLTNSYENGKLHGPTTYSFPNSSIIEKLYEYDNGILIKEVTHDTSGMPIHESAYELGDHKIITAWDNQGVPLSIEEYEKDRLIHGKYFNENNDLESSIQKGNGVRAKRDRERILQSKDVIQNGSIASRTVYHPNGQVQSEISFVNYQPHGEQLNYSPSGSIVARIYWDHGQLDGMKTIYQNDVKISEIPYAKGQRNGVERHYDSNGSLIAEIHWDNNKKHGSHRVYKDDATEIKWYYRGKAVSLNKFEEFQYREHLIADKDKFVETIQLMDAEQALQE